jgi:hypothetical protein
MEFTQRFSASTAQLLLGGMIASAILLLPITSFSLVRTYTTAPPSPSNEELQSEIPERYDANYHETRCYQVLTIRNYQEAQEQWEAPCACTANIAVLAEVEYENLLQRYNSIFSEAGTDYLLYDYYPTSRLTKEAEAARAILKDKYQRIVRDQCWIPRGLDKFWTNTNSKPTPIHRTPLLPPGSIMVVESQSSLTMRPKAS